ncbi:hypothetical protein WG66_016817 [Moniliophthora roreri]|uniref:Uncharacterized protein n=1 Tax=Moniliophthora roreri TaxID=221103 RepID=A0A0W0FIN4_MONRR|nr:hypothetical protein WG66_016817 [Moniliophthora roreri]
MSIARLLEEPFGPYDETFALQPCEKDPQQPRNKPLGPKDLNIKSLWMVHAAANRNIGLDETEFVDYCNTDTPEVQFHGIIVVKSLSWLTPRLLTVLDADIKERDAHLHGASARSLKGLYDRVKIDTEDERLVKLYIKFSTNMPACFMTVEQHSESLVLKAHPSKRDFVVKSLDVETYSRSRNYLERWRLYAFLRREIARQNNPPVEARTIKWIIDSMLEHHRQVSLRRRIIFDPEDSDMEDSVTGTTKSTRHLCHVSRHECTGILARHAEWLLAQQITTNASHHHIVNLRSLYKFCQKMKEVKRRKRRLGDRTWGMEYKVRPSDNDKESLDEVDLTRFGPGADWDERIKRYCLQKPTKTWESMLSNTPAPAPEPIVEAHYDSDFTVTSSSEYSDSSDSPPPSRTLDVKVPWWAWQNCQWNKIRFKNDRWQCPDDYCFFEVNLREIETRKSERVGISRDRFDTVTPGVVCDRLGRTEVLKHVDEHMHRNRVHFQRKKKDGAREIRVVEWPLPGKPVRQSSVKMEFD